MGTQIEVTAKKNEAEGTVMYDFGDNVQESIELFGEGPVHSGFVANSKVLLQAVMRRRLEAGQDVSDLTTTWKPGVTIARITDPVAAAKAKFAVMSDEERAAFLEELRAMQG